MTTAAGGFLGPSVGWSSSESTAISVGLLGNADADRAASEFRSIQSRNRLRSVLGIIEIYVRHLEMARGEGGEQANAAHRGIRAEEARNVSLCCLLSHVRDDDFHRCVLSPTQAISLFLNVVVQQLRTESAEANCVRFQYTEDTLLGIPARLPYLRRRRVSD